jgi:hypothetical protein
MIFLNSGSDLFNFIVMKIFLVIAAVIISFSFVKTADPLKNTKWRNEDLLIHFTASDTVKLFVDDKLVASALYKVKDSVLTWRDYVVSDASCDTSIRGSYIYTIKEDVLTFRLVNDKCEERANILQTLMLSKQ